MATEQEEETVINETVTNTTGRDAATLEGLIVAYTLMFSMALFPIFVGSLRSVQHHYNLRVSWDIKMYVHVQLQVNVIVCII